jgi:hypothetical protein
MASERYIKAIIYVAVLAWTVVLYVNVGGSQKRGHFGAEVAPMSTLNLSLLLERLLWNGPEQSRARRCWARRSEPLTARTVLR